MTAITAIVVAFVIVGVLYPFVVVCDSIKHSREITESQYNQNLFFLWTLGAVMLFITSPILVVVGWLVGCVPGLVTAWLLGTRLVCKTPLP